MKSNADLTLKNVAKYFEDKYDTKYTKSEDEVRAAIKLRDNSGRQIDVTFKNDRYLIQSDYSEQAFISYTTDEDIDSDKIEKMVRNIIKKDYSD